MTAVQQHLGWPLISSVGAALRAWRLALATQGGGVPAAVKATTVPQIRSMLQHGVYDALRLALRQTGGPDFVHHWASPERIEAGFSGSSALSAARHLLFTHEDQAAHKMKLVWRIIREQRGDVLVAGSQEAAAQRQGR